MDKKSSKKYELPLKFDKENHYIPLGERGKANVIRNSYRLCMNIYNWMHREPVHGHNFCRVIHPDAQQLREYIKDKSDDEIKANQKGIMALFKKWDKAVLCTAEEYQNDAKFDWAALVEWLCDGSERLERWGENNA